MARFPATFLDPSATLEVEKHRFFAFSASLPLNGDRNFFSSWDEKFTRVHF
jgi:hypothetical protein